MGIDKQRLWRNAVKRVLGPTLRWERLEADRDGYSIVLGVPWSLRHLLSVNLRFVAAQDLTGLDRFHVVFDRRPRPGGDELIEEIRGEFPDLPLDFRFHPGKAGWIVERVNRSKFYASLNWVTGLGRCRTRYAILHDFDLYPTDERYFDSIHRALRDNGLRFSGAEHTHFDGLTDEDGLVGTWSLGIDVEWLRKTRRPIECFHDVCPVNGRRVDLDAFSAIQAETPERALAEHAGPGSFIHVRNLVSTFLLFSEGRKTAKIAWRLHFLWYLESLATRPRDLGRITEEMNAADGPSMTVDGRTIDFSGVHHTCANVLAKEVTRMEEALHGQCRPEVGEYLEAVARFLANPR